MTADLSKASLQAAATTLFNRAVEAEANAGYQVTNGRGLLLGRYLMQRSQRTFAQDVAGQRVTKSGDGVLGFGG